MPEMNGKEAYYKMKEINPNIRVLICSGYSLSGDAKELMKEGINAFIQKPFRSHNLSTKISEVLAQ